ncbi:BON domain-containing protein [Marinobacterium arenosum]|uniref:BON domain-containing protein n=1 Tax=Marinobacterium arenosum TaxID=2862496 RepID=UPI001C980AF5|nr:BON domain-containing protein [Marinobacterium arenosum]MBY4676612.1 BON domain-containing protein [Marinobacterium arenosum]
MKTPLAAIILGTTLLLSGCASMLSDGQPVQQSPGHRTLGSYVDDELIETKALINLSAGSEELKAANVSVVSYNGIVLLTGQVPSEYTKQEAEQIVSEVRKVRRIHNELTISGTSSALARTNDTWLTTKVKTQLLANEAIDGGRIKVVTDGGTVYLMGLVSHAEADTAVQIVRGISGVQKIIKIFEYIDQP